MQFQIDTMTCGGCVRRVTAAVQAIDPHATVTADIAQHRVDIRSGCTQPQIVAALLNAGYPVTQTI